jgi:hypothetical protein
MINKGMLVTHEVPDKVPDPPTPTPPPIPDAEPVSGAAPRKSKTKKNQ